MIGRTKADFPLPNVNVHGREFGLPKNWNSPNPTNSRIYLPEYGNPVQLCEIQVEIHLQTSNDKLMYSMLSFVCILCIFFLPSDYLILFLRTYSLAIHHLWH